MNQKIDNLHYQTLFKKSLDGIYRSTPEGEYIDANPALVDMLGYEDKEELLTLNIPKELYYNGSQRPSAEERDGIFVTRLQKKDGSLIWAEINSWVVRDEQENVLYYEGIVRDITKRKKINSELYNLKEKMRITLQSIGDGVIVTNLEGRVEMINKVAQELTGWSQKEAVGKLLIEVFKIVNEYSREPEKNPVEKVLKSGKIEGLANHTVLIARDGRERAIADSAAPIEDKEGSLHGVVMVFRDITEERKMMNKIINSEKKYRTVFESTGTAMMMIEEDTTISMVNRMMEVITGYTREEIEGKMSWQDFVAKPEQCEEMLEYHKKRRRERGDRIPNNYEFCLKDNEGQTKEVMITVDVVPGTGQSIGSILDITERKRAEKRARYLGYHDELTGLYNRTFFEESLERLDTERQLPLSIIMGDVNGLKLINDGLGHQKGDKLLQKIAQILRNSCRQEDIIARWGGDEFVILLPLTENLEAKRVTDRIKSVCNQCSEEEDPIDPTIALGYATKKAPDQNIWEILKKAETWMYKHKLVESQSARSSIISSLEETLWEKDFETKEHAQRLKKLAIQMGKALGLPDNKLDELELLAGLHDIGKIAIPDNILMKPDSFSADEWETMQKHPEIGYRIAQASSELAPIAEGILYHHEWWDGTGYPQELKGENIPLISRIISIVDAYDVMTHERPYKNAISQQEAITEIKRCAGIQFDPHLVDIFLYLLE